jgi:hypothetical protein
MYNILCHKYQHNCANVYFPRISFGYTKKKEVGGYITGPSEFPDCFQQMNLPAIPLHISSMFVYMVTAVLDKTVCEHLLA